MSTYLIIGLFVLGLVIGRLSRRWPFVHKSSERLTMAAVFLLLFLLGISVGVNPEIMKNLPILGLQAGFLAVGALLGTLVLARITVFYFFKEKEE